MWVDCSVDAPAKMQWVLLGIACRVQFLWEEKVKLAVPEKKKKKPSPAVENFDMVKVSQLFAAVLLSVATCMTSVNESLA